MSKARTIDVTGRVFDPAKLRRDPLAARPCEVCGESFKPELRGQEICRPCGRRVGWLPKANGGCHD